MMEDLKAELMVCSKVAEKDLMKVGQKAMCFFPAWGGL